MFKRIGAFLFAVLLSLLICQVGAGAAETNNVKDFLNYLKSDEAAELQTAIDKIKADYSLDAVIVITDNTDGKSSRDYADDYYDYNGYGIGGDHSGLLMLVNMGNREVWISTTGRAISIYTDSRIDNIVDRVTGLLGEEEYYNACSQFINDVENYAGQGAPGDHQGVPGTQQGVPGGYQGLEVVKAENMSYLDKVVGLMKSFVVYIIAFIIAIVATVIASLSSKGDVTISNSTYEEKGSFVLSGTADDFIREHTTRTKIESSSDGSSTHSSSSGRSHGGGGGRF